MYSTNSTDNRVVGTVSGFLILPSHTHIHTLSLFSASHSLTSWIMFVNFYLLEEAVDGPLCSGRFLVHELIKAAPKKRLFLSIHSLWARHITDRKLLYFSQEGVTVSNSPVTNKLKLKNREKKTLDTHCWDLSVHTKDFCLPTVNTTNVIYWSKYSLLASITKLMLTRRLPRSVHTQWWTHFCRACWMLLPFSLAEKTQICALFEFISISWKSYVHWPSLMLF